MEAQAVVDLVKARLGISTAVRDTYLTAIAKSVITEMEDEKGLLLESDNDNHLLFLADYATWRYQSRDESGAMPRHLQFRLHNMILHAGRPQT